MLKIGIPMSTGKTQTYINTAYIDYMHNTGVITPVLLTNHVAAPEVAVDLDGLLLPGGIDLDPIYYMEDNYNSYSVDPEKDLFERDLFHAFRINGKPVFGICRGFQLIIREYMLYFDNAKKILEFVEHVGGHNQVEGQRLERTTRVHLLNCRSKRLYTGQADGNKDVDAISVNSMHHQCLTVDFSKKIYTEEVLGKELFNGFIPLAWTKRGIKESDKTKVICEAFEITGWNAPILGVQWHPEELNDTALLKNFFLRTCKNKNVDGHHAF